MFLKQIADKPRATSPCAGACRHASEGKASRPAVTPPLRPNGTVAASAGYQYDGAGRLWKKTYGNNDVVTHATRYGKPATESGHQQQHDTGDAVQLPVGRGREHSGHKLGSHLNI